MSVHHLLYLTMLVITHKASDLPQGNLQDGGSLRRGGVLAGTDWMPLIEWGMRSENWQMWSGHEVHRTQGDQKS
jgi:hypothetical protein